jgi:hypothetical protein
MNEQQAEKQFSSRELEEEIIKMLRNNLPLALTITRHGNEYIWQWLEAGGRAGSFVQALEQALTQMEVSYTEAVKE